MLFYVLNPFLTLTLNLTLGLKLTTSFTAATISVKMESHETKWLCYFQIHTNTWTVSCSAFL